MDCWEHTGKKAIKYYFLCKALAVISGPQFPQCKQRTSYLKIFKVAFGSFGFDPITMPVSPFPLHLFMYFILQPDLTTFYQSLNYSSPFADYSLHGFLIPLVLWQLYLIFMGSSVVIPIASLIPMLKLIPPAFALM